DKAGTQTYDANGRVVTQLDANNHAMSIAYDGQGGAAITDALGGISEQTHAGPGNLIRTKDELGATATLTYDASNRRTSVTDKAGNRETFTFHPQTGYTASQTDASGGTTSFVYTAQTQGPFTFYQLTSVKHADGTTTSSAYDAAGNALSAT